MFYLHVYVCIVHTVYENAQANDTGIQRCIMWLSIARISEQLDP